MKTFEQYEQYDPDMDYRKLIEDIIDKLEIKFDFIANYHSLYYFYENDIKFLQNKKYKWLYVDNNLRTYYNNAYDKGFMDVSLEILSSLNIYDYKVMSMDKNFKITTNKNFNENI